jgi:hypothetical protein
MSIGGAGDANRRHSFSQTFPASVTATAAAIVAAAPCAPFHTATAPCTLAILLTATRHFTVIIRLLFSGFLVAAIAAAAVVIAAECRLSRLALIVHLAGGFFLNRDRLGGGGRGRGGLGHGGPGRGGRGDGGLGRGRLGRYCLAAGVVLWSREPWFGALTACQLIQYPAIREHTACPGITDENPNIQK